MSARYAIGIDLGTTHSALSYLRADASQGRGPEQAVLPVPQLTAPGTVEGQRLLPSFLYRSAEGEFPSDALAVIGKSKGRDIVGAFARSHGAKVPTRLVASAKSWLAHPTVDRRADILPVGAPADVVKVSPVEASARYLSHLGAAWAQAFGKEAPLGEQDVVLTVPASFDAGARDLTLEAAMAAGLKSLTLLEEPQAALYAWLEAQGDGYRKSLKPGDIVLVVDVGGGTSDFSLIAVSESNGDLSLERLAVGDHILLGGDNMDLALAHAIAEKLAAQGKSLDAWQMSALTHACRAAKEKLFEDESLERVPVVVASRGSSLMGGTLKAEVERGEVEALLTDGFFPKVSIDEAPAPTRKSGFQQLGLPYAADAGITRHLAAFLKAHAPKGQAGFVRPTALLLNGGVFRAESLRERVKAVLNGWLKSAGAPPVRELPGADYDLAVARGAAYFAWVRAGHGIRIRAGTGRAYYVGVEATGPAVPGRKPKVKAVCVAPLGMEEGSSAPVAAEEFGLLVGQPTHFRFFSSSTRRDDKAGATVDDAEGARDLEELPPIEAALPAGKLPTGSVVAVQLEARVTELGALELACLERGGKGRWKLELNVRSEPAS